MLRILGFVLASQLIAAAAFSADLTSSENLFFIKRSKNANEVHYDAVVENCAWRAPYVDSYWRDLDKGPDVYEEIKWYEGSAYGFDVDPLSRAKITITLRALPEKEITAQLSKIADGVCSVVSTLEIDGKTAQLRSVYVYAEENFIGLPTVHYIDLLGYSEDGQSVFERIPQTDQGRGQSPPDASLWHSGAKTWGRP